MEYGSETLVQLIRVEAHQIFCICRRNLILLHESQEALRQNMI